MSFHTGLTLDSEGEDKTALPSVPGPESGWGYPFISLLLVTLQWGCLLGFYPIGALETYKGLGRLWSSRCPWHFLDPTSTLLCSLCFSLFLCSADYLTQGWGIWAKATSPTTPPGLHCASNAVMVVGRSFYLLVLEQGYPPRGKDTLHHYTGTRSTVL